MTSPFGARNIVVGPIERSKMNSAEKWETLERYLQGYPYSPYRDIELSDLETVVIGLRKGDIPDVFTRMTGLK